MAAEHSNASVRAPGLGSESGWRVDAPEDLVEPIVFDGHVEQAPVQQQPLADGLSDLLVVVFDLDEVGTRGNDPVREAHAPFGEAQLHLSVAVDRHRLAEEIGRGEHLTLLERERRELLQLEKGEISVDEALERLS